MDSWKKLVFAWMVFVSGFLGIAAEATDLDLVVPYTRLLDGRGLAGVKLRIQQGNARVQPACKSLFALADDALLQRHVSVIVDRAEYKNRLFGLLCQAATVYPDAGYDVLAKDAYDPAQASSWQVLPYSPHPRAWTEPSPWLASIRTSTAPAVPRINGQLGLLVAPHSAEMVKIQPAQAVTETRVHEPRDLKSCILPAKKAGGFTMDGYILWCSSVIKVDGTYHMFASRWPDEYGLGGWTKYSECVRATSRDLLGPYTFQEVVLEKRPDNWDNTRVHNVKIVKAGNKYVLYYIDSANETGYAVADAVTGPWTRLDHLVMRVSNPSIHSMLAI